MTKKDIKYVLLFQNKLSSKPGPHMPVSVMFGNSLQARSEGVAPVASRYSYELTQKSPFRSEINPSSRVDYIKFITKHTFLC